MSENSLATESPFVLAANLRRLMQATPGMQRQEDVAKKSGVAQTSISLMLRPDARAATNSGKTPSPKMSEVELVARAFGLEVWLMLVDPSKLGEVVAKALSSAVPPAMRQPELQPEAERQNEPQVKAVAKKLATRTRKAVANTTVETKMPITKQLKAARENMRRAMRPLPPDGDLVTGPDGKPR